METKKKFKFNWGWGIFTFYTLFILATSAFVYFTTRQDEDLVTPDYYQKTLIYQQHIDKAQRALDLRNPVRWKLDSQGHSILFEYPSIDVKGRIKLFRPSDAKQDRTIDIEPTPDGYQTISIKGLDAGLWKIEVDWSENGKEYYQEQRLILSSKS